RWREGLPLNEPDQATFYTDGAEATPTTPRTRTRFSTTPGEGTCPLAATKSGQNAILPTFRR
ncbi:hypothetical protein AHiyo6_32240, partial [Arthrobacter sp. Hiyo6]